MPNEELAALMTDNPSFFTAQLHTLRTLLKALQTTWLHTPQILHYILTLQTTWLDSLPMLGQILFRLFGYSADDLVTFQATWLLFRLLG